VTNKDEAGVVEVTAWSRDFFVAGPRRLLFVRQLTCANVQMRLLACGWTILTLVS
jgi:hypothetical protein